MKTGIYNCFISVIVCTHNRGHKIANCLNSLLKQSYAKFEIIVVNDKSTDDTESILTNFVTIKKINNKYNLGLSASRNVGAKHAIGDILAFTDDDCIADINWIKNLELTYRNSIVAGVGGKITPYKTDKWLFKYYDNNNPLSHLPFSLNKSTGIFYRFFLYIKRTFTLTQLSSKDLRLYAIVGANMSMRKTTFDMVGGFNENIEFCGDDMDFWHRFRALNSGYELRYAPNAIIQHDYDSSFRDALRRNYYYGAGQAGQYFNFRNIIPVIFPFPILILSFLLLSVIKINFLPISAIFTILLYPGWIIIAFKKKNVFYFGYSFVQALLELTLTIGFVFGYIKSVFRHKI